MVAALRRATYSSVSSPRSSACLPRQSEPPSARRWGAAWLATPLRESAPSRGRCPPRRYPAPAPRAPHRNAACMAAPGEHAEPVVVRRLRRSAGRKVTGTGPERRALSGSAPLASTVLRIRAARGLAVDRGDFGRLCGPNGEGPGHKPGPTCARRTSCSLPVLLALQT